MMDIDKQLHTHLDALMQMDKPEVFGPAFVQRHCRIGYNNACHVLDLGVRAGMFVQSDVPYRYKVVRDAASDKLTSQMTKDQVHARINLLTSEIDENEAKNRAMQAEINGLYRNCGCGWCCRHSGNSISLGDGFVPAKASLETQAALLCTPNGKNDAALMFKALAQFELTMRGNTSLHKELLERSVSQ